MLRWGAGWVSRSRIPIPASRVPSVTCKEWPNNWYSPHTSSMGCRLRPLPASRDGVEEGPVELQPVRGPARLHRQRDRRLGERFAGMEFENVGSVASPLQATPEDEHIAAVAVDVHLRGVKRQDCERALHAASQGFRDGACV